MSDHLGVTIQRSTNIIAAKDAPEVMSYAEAVFRRRSMRNFVDSGLSASQCYTLLSMLCSESSILDDSDPTRADSIAVGILAGNVEGTIPGFFLLDRQKRSLGLVAEGFVLDDMAHICLGQSWMAKSALHVLFLTNLKVVERMRGPRGYRHAMMAAGRLGQRIYLAATSMRLGCCGIGAFYDSEAVRLLGLNDESALLYLVAVGPVKKWSQAPE
jgi:nitroreductase